MNARSKGRMSFKGARPVVKGILVWIYKEGTWGGRVYGNIVDATWVRSGPLLLCSCSSLLDFSGDMSQIFVGLAFS